MLLSAAARYGGGAEARWVADWHLRQGTLELKHAPHPRNPGAPVPGGRESVFQSDRHSSTRQVCLGEATARRACSSARSLARPASLLASTRVNILLLQGQGFLHDSLFLVSRSERKNTRAVSATTAGGSIPRVPRAKTRLAALSLQPAHAPKQVEFHEMFSGGRAVVRLCGNCRYRFGGLLPRRQPVAPTIGR